MTIAVTAIDALKTALQSVAELSNSGDRMFHVLSEEEIVALAGAVPFPAVGILYEGIRSNLQSQPSHRTGAAGQVSFALVLFYKTIPQFTLAGKEENNRLALQILDAIRKKLLDTRGPGDKFWQFVAEAPAFEKNDVVMFIQRWALPTILL